MADDSGHSDTHSAAASLEALAEVLRQMGTSKSATGSGEGEKRGAEGALPALVSQQVIQLVGQVMLAWVASGLRSWAHTAEICGKSLPLLVESLAAAAGRANGDGAEQARALDQLRASLRELAELPGREAQRLRLEIERIFLGEGRDAGPASDPHWRRWAPKP